MLWHVPQGCFMRNKDLLNLAMRGLTVPGMPVAVCFAPQAVGLSILYRTNRAVLQHMRTLPLLIL